MIGNALAKPLLLAEIDPRVLSNQPDSQLQNQGLLCLNLRATFRPIKRVQSVISIDYVDVLKSQCTGHLPYAGDRAITSAPELGPTDPGDAIYDVVTLAKELREFFTDAAVRPFEDAGISVFLSARLFTIDSPAQLHTFFSLCTQHLQIALNALLRFCA